MEPLITVVVPVRNEARFIEDTLTQILEQDYPAERLEIIVADGGSEDGTSQIVAGLAARFPQIRLVNNPGKRSSAGRNIGFRQGRGEFFLVIDGHCHIDNRQLLRNLADRFARSGADCLGRPQPLDPPGLSRFQQAVAAARASRLGHGGGSLIYSDYEGYASPVSNGAAYRRRVFDLVGYVDETFDACEDVEFNYRVEQAGLVAYTSPALKVRYYPREDLPGLLRQMLRYGRGRLRLARKHPQTLSMNTLVPSVLVLGLFSLAPLLLLFAAARSWGGESGFVLLFLLPVGLGLAAYALLVVGTSLLLAARQGPGLLPWLPQVFFAIHLGLGLGFLQEWRRRHHPRAAASPGAH